MDIPFFYIIFLIIIIISVYKFFFSEKAKIKRKLKNAPLKKIANFKNNEIAKIVGNIEIIDQPLISPLANRKCAFYYIRIERKSSSGKNSHWKTIVEEEVSQKFLIRDGEDYAYINDSNIKSYIVQDKMFSSGFGNDATERLEKYLISKGIESEGFFGFNKTLRYYEGVLENNEKIAVFGKGNWKDATGLNLPNQYKTVLEITSDQGLSVYLSDDPDTTLKQVKKQKLNSKDYNFNRNYRK